MQSSVVLKHTASDYLSTQRYPYRKPKKVSSISLKQQKKIFWLCTKYSSLQQWSQSCENWKEDIIQGVQMTLGGVGSKDGLYLCEWLLGGGL